MVKVWRFFFHQPGHEAGGRGAKGDQRQEEEQAVGQPRPGGAHHEKHEHQGHRVGIGYQKAIVGYVHPPPVALAIFAHRHRGQHLPALPGQMGEAPPKQDAKNQG